jgi:pyrroloquinoline-quinone synthase
VAVTLAKPATSLAEPPLAARLRERLLAIMDHKDHSAWPRFQRPGLTRAQLLAHFRHEYRTYVRDFPSLLARVLGQGPPADARAALAENIYEEQTGKLSFGVSHPDLFLDMMAGLGFDRDALEADDPPLAPEARLYRGFLERVSAEAPWVVGAAVLTIFVEGSVHERAELAGTRDLAPVDDAIRAHPLVAFYGCPPDRMRLVRAHRAVERGHRADAWRMVIEHAGRDEALAARVVAAVEEARVAWLAYRDGVARAMSLDG